MHPDEKGVEQRKIEFYRIEDWENTTGFPKRKTLEDLGLKKVADLLQAKNKLGST